MSLGKINTQKARTRLNKSIWGYVVAASLLIGAVVPMLGNQRTATAAPSAQLNFQARLLTAAGAPVPDGLYNIQFKLYTAASGGVAIWTESWEDTNGVAAGQDYRVRVTDGYLSVALATHTAFPAADWGSQHFITMNVGGTDQTTPVYDGEMLNSSNERMQLTAVPYAFAAANVGSGDTNAGSTNSSGVAITTGDALGATSNSGNIVMDTGTATGTAGTINIGATNASAVTLGRSGVTTTVNGTLSIAGGTDYGVYYRDSSDNVVTTAAGSSNECLRATTGAAPSWGSCSGTGDIIQGGNSFAAAMVIGTNDAYDLQLEVGGTTRLTIDTNGDATLTGELTVSGAGTSIIGGDLRVDGGDITTAAGDLTIAPAGADTFITGDLDVSANITAGNADEFAAGTGGIDYFGDSTSALRVGFQAGIPLVGIDTDTGNGTNATIYAASSAADAGTTTKDSSILQFTGSYFSGSAQFNTFSLQNDITGTTASDYKLSIKNSASTEILALSGAGDLTVNGTGTSTFAGSLSVQGDTTLGNANTDTTTINGTAISAPNNLNFDSNTLYIDTTNNFVNIGSTTSDTSRFKVDTSYSSAVAGEQRAVKFESEFSTADTGIKQGLRVNTNSGNTSGSIVDLVGGFFLQQNNGNGGTTDNSYGVWARNDVGAGHTVTNSYGFNVSNSTNSGTLTNQYGLRVGNLTSGTNDYGIYVAGADTYALWIDAGASRFDGTVDFQSTIASSTGTLTVADDFAVNGNITLGDATSDTITFTGRVNSTIAPSANDSYDLGASTLIWNDLYVDRICFDGNVDCATTTSALNTSGWTDGGTVVDLTTDTDDVVIGGSTAYGKLTIDGDTDERQLVVKAHSTQTNPLIVGYTDSNTELFRLSARDIESVFLGYQAGQNDDGTTNYNTGIGGAALDAVTSGAHNTAVGNAALGAVVTGASNSAFGSQALANSTGSYNSVFGQDAFSANVTGQYNVGLGMQALRASTAGSFNTVVGTQAGYGNGAGDTDVQANVFLGYRAGYANEGNNNILIGYQAGDNITTGSSNLLIGYNIDAPVGTSSNQLSIGNILFGSSIDGTGTTVSTGNLTVGSSTDLSAQLAVDGKADRHQLLIKGHSTQNQNLVVFEQDGNTDLFTLSGTGNATYTTATNSTTGFVIQNSSNQALFTADTTNNALNVLGATSGKLSSWTTDTAITDGNGGTTDTRDNATAVYYNGYAYMIGGDQGAGGLTTVYYTKVNPNGSLQTPWTNQSPSGLTGRTYASAVAVNGYMYLIGGSTNGTDGVATVEFAKINLDGSLGTFTATTSLTASRKNTTAVSYNGYIYVVGGNSSNTGTPAYANTVYYGKVNGDGTISSWTTNAQNLPAVSAFLNSTIANGYLYVIGSQTTGGSRENDIYYGKINADGSVAAFTTQSNAFTPASIQSGIAVLNGYVYVYGGTEAATEDEVYYAPLNANGSVGSWTTSAAADKLPATRSTFGHFTANGYMYAIGGWTGSAATNSVYYTTGPRLKVGGALDLVGYGNGGSSEGGIGGQLTAGNTRIVGSLEVQDSANFWRAATFGSDATFHGALTQKYTGTNAFSVESASGTTPVLSVDTTNSRVGINTTALNNTLNINAANTANAAAELLIYGTAGTKTGLVIQQHTGQSVSNFIIEDAYSTDFFTVHSSGYLTVQNLADSQQAYNFKDQDGNQVLNIDTANQRVAIGNTGSPSSALHIYTGSDTSQYYFEIQGATDNLVRYFSDASTNTRFESQVRSNSYLASNNPFARADWPDVRLFVETNSASSKGLVIEQNNAGSQTADYFQIRTGGTSGDIFTVAANGRIGIGADTPSYDLSFGEGANRTIGLEARGSNAAGRSLTVSAGAAGTGAGAFAGGQLNLQGGAAAGTGTANGGNVYLTGGAGVGSGVKGLVVIDTPTYTTTTNTNCAVNCTIDQSNIDSNGAVIVNATATGLTISMPDPTNTTAGRIVYITAANGSSDFTLSVNGGGVGNVIAMRQNTTATMIWNGSDWTAAGASSSTTLQAAYDNTLTAAGGAEIVLNNTSSANGLTIRNNSTSPIIGGILEAQTSIGSNLFSVNNNATEYANNGGAETAGASTSTFPAGTWSAAPAGGTVSRYITAGDNIATGTASVYVDATATANTGAANTLNASLTPNLKYAVSYAVRHTSTSVSFNTLDTIYSRDGTNTSTTSCETGGTATNGIWTRVTCTFTAPSSGITSSNAIFIRHSDAVDHDYYIDNLSVTVSADVNHASDGSVDSALGTNWTAFGTLDALTRDTSILFDTSASVAVDTPAAVDRGVRNNLSITPAISTQYLVSFYARTSVAFSDIRVRYSRDGGTNFVNCVDYNTQTISTTGFTKVTCLFTTDSTTATDPDLIIDQPTATNRIFYIDALSVTLNTNNASNVQIGGANRGGPVTLFTLDRASSAPIASNNDAYLGSMYYDTTTGRIQCYEEDGWGACGSAPDNYVNLNPEYSGAVLNGTGVGTMTADFCANQASVLTVNTGLCASGESRNYYKWTSPQATTQTYSVYVSYQLPSTFKQFASDDTVQLTARVDDTTDATVTYEMFRSESGVVVQCGTGETTVTTTNNTWQTVGINGNESTSCGFATNSANAFVIFKINVKAKDNANAYISTLSFTTTGR